MSQEATWGVVATVKAPTRDILDFAAHHLDLGAHRVCIYLDAQDDAAQVALRGHPKCRFVVCDAAYWARRGRKERPAQHQQRQSVNATHCLNRRPAVDWLAHLDVDEFLWPATPIGQQLAALPASAVSAHVRPVEALAPDPRDPPPPGVQWFKACARLRERRREETETIYPTFGPHLNGGFVSHVAGKVFVRTGIAGLSLRIHNAYRNGIRDDLPGSLPGTWLCHFHAASWEHWRARYRYRLRQGSYRPGLKPPPLPDDGALTMHDLFRRLETEGGDAALRRFFAEVCIATPELRARLSAYGRLHAMALDLGTKRARHFPDYG